MGGVTQNTYSDSVLTMSDRDEFLAKLAAAVAVVVTDPASLEAYQHDRALLAPAGTPLAAVRAASTEDVVATIALCREYAVPLVTRGAGTGLAGAANALDGCVVLSMAGMNRILDIDPIGRTARVQPGVINGDLDAAVRDQGLWYVPDPGSRAICSIGGNLATNAGGMCCAKYGVTRDHVLELTAVLGTGEIVHTGRATRKDVVGLDLTRLLIGSEGTLGVFVEATVRLRPRPSAPATVAATFPSVAAAIVSVLELTACADPAAVELMDNATVRAVESYTRMGLDTAAGAVVLAQFDGAGVGGQAAAYAEIAGRLGAETFATDDADDGEALMTARRMAIPALEQLGTLLLDDVGVAVHHLPELVAAIEAIAQRRGVTIATFGHAADGNLHPTVVFDPTVPTAVDAARLAFDDILDAALALGGTVSGEHGIGSLKHRHVELQIGPVERALMHRIKSAFDPDGILNPGRAY